MFIIYVRVMRAYNILVGILRIFAIAVILSLNVYKIDYIYRIAPTF